jgi:hypothetical protein
MMSILITTLPTSVWYEAPTHPCLPACSAQDHGFRTAPLFRFVGKEDAILSLTGAANCRDTAATSCLL